MFSRLRDVLQAYMAEKDYHPEISALKNGNFPPEILGKHCVAAWRAAFRFGKKQK